MSHPALRTRSSENMFATVDLVAVGMAQRLGRDPAEFEVRCFAGAVVGALIQVIQTWMTTDGAEPLPVIVDRTLAYLESGLPL